MNAFLRTHRTRLVNALLAVLVLATAAAAYAATGPPAPRGPFPTAAEVKRSVVVSSVSADGNVQSPEDLSLGFETSGRLVEVAVREGERVRKGQLLARIDDAPARARLASAQEGLAAARERLRDTRAGRTADELARNERLADQGRVAVRNAERALDDARGTSSANVAGLRHAIGRARVSGELAQLRASELRLAQERVEIDQQRSRYRRLRASVGRLRADLDRLRDQQRARTNAQLESSLRRFRAESELTAARSASAAARGAAEQARQARATTCAAAPASPGCTAAVAAQDRAEAALRDAEGGEVERQRELEQSQQGELDDQRAVNDLQFATLTLQTRIATGERDEATAKTDLDSSDATARTYLSEVDRDRTALREARRALGAAADNLSNGIAQARQQVDQARSSVTSSEASLRVSLATNRIDEQGADAARIAADRASVASSDASVEDAREALARTRLVAPADGVAASVDAKVGELVGGGLGASALTTGSGAEPSGGSGASSGSSSTSPPSSGQATGSSGEGAGGEGIIELTRLEDLQVEAGFSEIDAARVSIGDPATISVDALPDQKLAAHVASIDPTERVVNNVVTYDVTVVLDSPPAALKPGMTATTDVFVDQSEGALSVPKAAVRSPRGASPTVNVLLPDGRQEARLVVTGLEGDSSVEVLGGVGEGERVVVGGIAAPPPPPGS